jgi:hypothetical protein
MIIITKLFHASSHVHPGAAGSQQCLTRTKRNRVRENQNENVDGGSLSDVSTAFTW